MYGGAGNLTVALWRFASLRLAPVSIRMCPLGFPPNTSHVPLVSPRPKGGANGGIIAKTSLFLHILESKFWGSVRLPVVIVLWAQGGHTLNGTVGGDAKVHIYIISWLWLTFKKKIVR